MTQNRFPACLLSLMAVLATPAGAQTRQLGQPRRLGRRG